MIFYYMIAIMMFVYLTTRALPVINKETSSSSNEDRLMIYGVSGLIITLSACLWPLALMVLLFMWKSYKK